MQFYGNTITGYYTKMLYPKEGFTIRITLPDGYFVTQKATFFDIVAIAAPILFAIITIMLWYKKGKDAKVVEVIEFNPPDDLNSLDLAYCYKGKVNENDVISLMVYLANKGYLKIEESADSKRVNGKSYKITKLKNYDEDNEDEKRFFNGLFAHAKRNYEFIKKDGDVNALKNEPDPNAEVSVTEEDLEGKFYTTIDTIMQKKNSVFNRGKIFENGFYKVWIFVMAILTAFTMGIRPYICGSDSASAIIALNVIIIIVYTIILALSINGTKVNTNVRIDPISFIAILIVFLPIMVGPVVAIFFLGTSVLEDLDTLGIIELVIQVACIITMLVFMTLMRRRTEYGTQILGRIRGFKTFLETAEKDRLEKLVNDDPKYFYKILPYAYVLGVSNVWMKKFEEIAVEPPTWYEGYDYFDYMVFRDSFDRLMRDSLRSMDYKPEPSSSSRYWSSGSSGGFSGGGFSGGGSGGGGGSSW